MIHIYCNCFTCIILQNILCDCGVQEKKLCDCGEVWIGSVWLYVKHLVIYYAIMIKFDPSLSHTTLSQQFYI